MIHKHSDNSLINMVNYMANSYNGPRSFYSFCEITGDYKEWGMLVDGVYYCALFLFETEMYTPVSDQEDTESKMIEDGQLYAVLLKGSDNCSFVKRFETREEMEDWARTVKEVDPNAPASSYLWYNS